MFDCNTLLQWVSHTILVNVNWMHFLFRPANFVFPNNDFEWLQPCSWNILRWICKTKKGVLSGFDICMQISRHVICKNKKYPSLPYSVLVDNPADLIAFIVTAKKFNFPSERTLLCLCLVLAVLQAFWYGSNRSHFMQFIIQERRALTQYLQFDQRSHC